MARVGIDASNLRAGGTVTHLVELLRAADPARYAIEEVVVWAGSAVLKKIEDRPWLRKTVEPLLEQAENPFSDRRHLYRAYWQRFELRKLARAARCDLLFVPGGMDNSGFHSIVAMSRNMLPFDLNESRRYGFSLAAARLLLLRRLQARTFRNAAGVIFLTDYARETISKAVGAIKSRTAVIPHGVSTRFSFPPRPQRSISTYSLRDPFKLLYVSTIDMYKHQWHVAEAVAQLRASGIPVVLDLVGPANSTALSRLFRTLERTPAASSFISYRGSVAYNELHRLYEQADLKVFASSCENMPNTLAEAMTAGLPIACSNCRPMRDILADAGVYFDPERPAEIAEALKTLIASPGLRARNAALGFEKAKQYSWERCAHETFSFLAECATHSNKQRPNLLC